jgi:hypothetical protein
MNISHIWHLFCPEAYLLPSLPGFFALYFTHIPLHVIHYIMMILGKCVLCEGEGKHICRIILPDDTKVAVVFCTKCLERKRTELFTADELLRIIDKTKTNQ